VGRATRGVDDCTAARARLIRSPGVASGSPRSSRRSMSTRCSSGCSTRDRRSASGAPAPAASAQAPSFRDACDGRRLRHRGRSGWWPSAIGAMTAIAASRIVAGASTAAASGRTVPAENAPAEDHAAWSGRARRWSSSASSSRV
jgi:hypothetical protein